MTSGPDVATPVRVGLLGCGRIARLVHLRALTSAPGVDLTALADPDPAALAAASRLAIDAIPFHDWRDLLGRGDVEAVVIALPTHLHAEAAVAALDAGIAVYVEKPLAATLEDGRAIARAAAASGTVGATGFNLRHHPAYRRARDLLAAGAAGRLVAARSVFTSAPRELPEWKRRRATGGGVLLDLASHAVDLTRFLTGRRVVEVACRLRSVQQEDDTALLTLGLDDGTPVSVLTSSTAAARDAFELAGDVATLTVDRFDRRGVQVRPAVEDRSRRGRLLVVTRSLAGVGDALRPPGEPSFAAAFSAFAVAVRGGSVEVATIDDGLWALAVVEAAEEAAVTGRQVTVRDPLADTGVSAKTWSANHGSAP